ncbi:adenylate/guanylate cyclase domain-containing protein [Ideonella sp. YS5]|uniref:adenylate/guanylate cyclase domain-containing protein n=1 Tax=Ideonella sp. YS5 TaxID=3453714 RepID=UPI003EEC2AAE
MPTIKRRTVLFADLRGSTALYESLGNAQATAVVTQTINALAQRVPVMGGQVIKTLGDGLMAVFSVPAMAVASALQMQDLLESTIAAPHAAPAVARLKLQIALALGEVVEMNGDCFGDAVNVAARLLDHAGDNETLITGELYDELPLDTRGNYRSLDRMHLRGRAEPVDVHMLPPRSVDATATLMETRFDLAEPEGLQVLWRESVYRFTRADLPVLIGRGSACGLQIDEARVSRTHARIDWMGGGLQVVDLSINGTYVRFAGDDEVLSLRRGACTLHGSGEIGLGGSPNEVGVPVLQFSVMASLDDTVPMRLNPPPGRA